MLEIYCDGACENTSPRPETKKATFGFSVVENGIEVHAGHGLYLTGPGATSSVAEYAAIFHAVQWLTKNRQGSKATIKSDSQFVIRQLQGVYGVHLKKPLPYHGVYSLTKKAIQDSGCRLSYEWIPRGRNGRADGLSKLDQG